jgi:hypothetical protein
MRTDVLPARLGSCGPVRIRIYEHVGLSQRTLVKRGEVGVCGADAETLFERQRCHVGVGDEFAAELVGGDEAGQDIAVAC